MTKKRKINKNKRKIKILIKKHYFIQSVIMFDDFIFINYYFKNTIKL